MLRGISRIDDAIRHEGAKFATARERNNARKVIPWNLEVGGKSADMPVILPDRVLEGVLAMVDGLRPLRGVLVGEYPAGVVLGFDDEDPVLADNDVVDLRCRPVRERQIGVIENLILLGQTFAKPRSDDSLPSRTFAGGRIERRDDQPDSEEDNDYGNHSAHVGIITFRVGNQQIMERL